MPENTGNISVFLCFPLIIRFMRPIIIPKTQIDHQRPVHLQCLSHQIVDPLDQFRCPGKRILLWNSHFHNQEITFIGNASVHTTGSPSVSGCDSKHSSPVSADIHRRNKASALVFSKCKRLINFFFRIFCSCPISCRWFSRNSLIP